MSMSAAAAAFAAKRAARPPPPAVIGFPLSQIQTPSLLVSLPAIESNELKIRKLIQDHNNNNDNDGKKRSPVKIRPHFKAHKSSSLATWQLDRICASSSPSSKVFSGFCVQTITEAEALVEGCVGDNGQKLQSVLLTNSPGSRGTAERLALLQSRYPSCDLSTVVDCMTHIDALDDAVAGLVHSDQQKENAKIGVYVEIECGQDRCGAIAGSKIAVELAQAVLASPHLTFDGLHVYHGGIQHVRSTSDRLKEVVEGPAAATTSTISALEEAGIDTTNLIVTGGGTGTLIQDLEAGTHTELQPGSYLFMDGDYGRNEEGTSIFQQSLYVHTTVVSRDMTAGKAVVDAGTKAVDLLCGMPIPTSIGDDELANRLKESDITFSNGGDEHGILRGLPEGILPVGSTLQLVPSHCDPTVNLHDWLVAVRDGTVEETWPVDARGYAYR